MKNEPIIPTAKIIFWVIFVSAALMSSLFIYHSKPKAPTGLRQELGTLFPVGRDIKPFKLITGKEQPFRINNFQHHWSLLFFGFTHCSSICPTTLDLLNKTYPRLQAKFKNLQVIFITLDPAHDQPNLLAQYTNNFNPNFISVTGKLNEIRKLQSQLGIFATSIGKDGQLDHSGNILLINPQAKWVGLFKNGLAPDELIEAVETGIQG